MSRLSRGSTLTLATMLLVACQPTVRPDAPQTDPAVPRAGASVPAGSEKSPPIEALLDPQALPSDPLQGAALVEPTVPGPTPSLSHGRDVFARINKGLSPGACIAGSNSGRWRQRYAGNPAAFARQIENVLPLLDFVSTEVERQGLPAEFVFIPLVESWYKPDAMGPGGPAGMWQMISSTARNHGIHIKPGYDGRLSPVESTRAALSYLKTLQGMFGGWQGIVMAYNAGEGRMMRAFRQSANRDVSAEKRKPHGLSNITYDYVAKLQALSCLVAEPERQRVSLPNSTAFVPLAPVLMGSDIDRLEQFGSRQNVDPALLRKLNPGYRSGRVVAGIPRLVLMPYAGAQPVDTTVGAQETKGELSSLTAEATPSGSHRVLSGESLWSIAKLYRMTIENLRRINRLGSRSIVRPGQTLKLAP